MQKLLILATGFVIACGGGGTARVNPEANKVRSSGGNLALWADKVKDRGKRVDIYVSIRNETNNGMLVPLNQIKVVRAGQQARLRHGLKEAKRPRKSRRSSVIDDTPWMFDEVDWVTGEAPKASGPAVGVTGPLCYLPPRKTIKTRMTCDWGAPVAGQIVLTFGPGYTNPGGDMFTVGSKVANQLTWMYTPLPRQ